CNFYANWAKIVSGRDMRPFTRIRRRIACVCVASVLVGMNLALGRCLKRGAAFLACFILLSGLAAHAQVQRSMINTGFEVPLLPRHNCYQYAAWPDVPGWQTTHPAGNGRVVCDESVVRDTADGPLMEIWSHYEGVVPRSGENHAELNVSAN